MEVPDEPVTEYGVVQIVGGRHKGKVGCYDDDNEWGNAIVYTGVPLLTDDFFSVNKKFLRQPTPEQRQAYESLFAAQMEEMKREDEERARQAAPIEGKTDEPSGKPRVRKAAWRRN